MLDFSARKIFTIPNFISASRIFMVPFIGWLLFIDSVPARLAAGVLLFLAIFSDFLDGWLARLLDQVSDLGKIIDPLADKLFVILLALVLIVLRDFPLWLALLIVGKDVLIVGAGIFVTGRKRVVMQSNIIGKYAFSFQAGLVVCYFLDFPFGEWSFTIGSVVLIAASLVSYGKALLFVLRSSEEVVVVSLPPQIVPTWARRGIVVLLLALVLGHFYFWTQENGEVVTSPVDHTAIDREQAEVLAERYAPAFLFDSGDEARPVAVREYLKGAELRRGARHLFALLDERVKAAPLTTVDLAAANGIDAYLAVPDAGKSTNNSPSQQARVYARAFAVGEGNGEWIVIQYWLFFPLEETGAGRWGDWQVAAVYLNSDATPRYLALSQGFYGSALSWSELELRGGRPVVYVAPGSHSLYFGPGEKSTYLDEERLLPFGSEMVRGDKLLDTPGGYGLKLLGGADEDWLRWPGRWGGPLPGGDRGPRFWNPKKPERAPWSHPLEFMRFYLEEGSGG